ncbi:hypothetical protein FD49_GL000234 [Latilactobacillus sakei subsp. sakei DSM 20017 = JCM 1157]|uniref:LarC family nickel insertion protein n=1 Tax=Latilactobacillus sakei TaxID=1599 RepID=UPI0006F17F32|nr:LarC family nickel insertion protein [Latilactobacillus sakei]KRK72129.1 hypothetical protein FD49_GL000234 [Latilactobacillus sakei subsp. sakei DSM 20017 = JCM 1157]MDG9751438.1 LarC family nickel insertion protein [Latilactobacillus sakei]TDG57318.1 hypothetical protein C5L17_001110 [Latilactobacillus sakei subsp. sakei]USF99889.1 lactate racemization operon protein [Latilactobacillus sakei subsp. sakei]GEL36646.1 hypothetical protein LSA02_13810 [Latilactobacillus sakei subsp. sakei]
MRTLYLDAFSGISGDMFIGALLDLGVDFKQFETELAKLNVTGYHLHAQRIAKSSIYGTDFDVHLPETVHKDEGFIETTSTHHHDHPHQHADGHTHSHGDEVRHLKDIEAIIDHSDLSNYVKTNAKQVFTEIAKSEAIVHELPLSDVHFHEVGALDSIVDIVGAFVALELLAVDQVYSSELTDGSGFIKVAHGMMPVPVPAVMQMRVGSAIPIKQNPEIHTELITPTGMGIVKTIVDQFCPIPDNQTITKVGYGFGNRETPQLNALRVMLCEKKTKPTGC